MTSPRLAKPPLDFFGSPHAPYYIFAPRFTHRSGGIRALYHLCHALNEAGYEAYISSSKPAPGLRTPPLTPEIQESHQADDRVPVTVYPEIQPGNLLQGAVVARWLLNKAGHLHGHKDFAPDELFFYWDECMLSGEKNAEKLFVPLIDRRIFHPGNTLPENRSGFCYYANKYFLLKQEIAEHVVHNGISLSQRTPLSPWGIAEILRTAKVLYCYEPSAIAVEALSCGCPVVLVMTDYLRQFDPSQWELKLPMLSEAEIATADFSVPPVDMDAWNAYLDNIERDAAGHIALFIEITQAAAKAYTEKNRDPTQMLERGIAAFQAEYFDQASMIFSNLLETQTQNPLLPAYLAFIAARQGFVQEAHDFIEKSSRIAPDRADLKAALGEAFLQSGRPDLACHYLEDAIASQPGLLAAYPSLAQGLYLTHQSGAAVSLLQSAASIPSPMQAGIQGNLLGFLEQRGDVAEFADCCLKFSQSLADDLLAVHSLSRFESSGERLLETLGRIQMQLADGIAPGRDRPEPAPVSGASPTGRPLKIAFMVGDFARERNLGRLAALLRFRPPGSFTSLLLTGDPQYGDNDYARLCSLLAEQTLSIHGMEDAKAQEEIQRAAPDILIDLDAYGPAERLAVFLRAEVKHKLLWGEAPMPPLSPDCRVLAGDRLTTHSVLPCVALPEMGEYCDFPELPIATETRSTAHPALGCLTPAMRVGREGWQLFAEILAIRPECQLLVNLGDLGEAAQDAICTRFAHAGIAAERLRFVHAHTPEDLCRFWREADLGLAPPVDAGDLALPACLWMGKPYLSLASPLPWARRPAALLEMAGAAEWIAETPEAYVEYARRAAPKPEPAFRARMKAAGLNDPIAFARDFAASMAIPSGRQ
ncbi:MAG: hypothetical protein LBK55_01910 [Azoarcus sp.]|jgi:tetratricopeptide (TPR) repeat protein|nr:hypothetical protein [Azoarcus sp.]